MNPENFPFASDAFIAPPIYPRSTAPAPAVTPALNNPSPLLNALLLTWPARGSAWVNKLHDFLIDKGFDTVEDLWLLANGLKQNKPRMMNLFNQLVQRMSFKDADHEKMEYLLASIPHPVSIFTTPLHVQNEHLPSTEGSADEPKKRVKRAAPLMTSLPPPMPYADAVPPVPPATISAAAPV